jgi:hypothetical protein
MVAAFSQAGAHPGLAEAVYRQTEGNPLFVQEVLRSLEEEGQIVQIDGRWAHAGHSETDTPFPVGLREVIGKRMSRLSAECVRLLTVAAVIGREFRLDLLQQVAELDDEALIAGVEQAVRVGVLEEHARVGTVTYRFGHALFRQSLYEELSAPRRARVHRDVARMLEQQYADRAEEHAVELAEHFGASSNREDLAKAVGYGKLAAQAAMGVFAYVTAVRLLERALEVQQALNPGDVAKRCDLLLALAGALEHAGEPRRVFEDVAEEAFELAERQADQDRAARACSVAMAALQRFGGNAMWGKPIHQRWLERTERYATGSIRERILAAIPRHALLIGPGSRWREAWLLQRQTLEMARQLGERDVLFDVAMMVTRPAWTPEQWHEQLELACEIAPLPTDGVSSRTLQLILRRLHQIFTIAGDRAAADEASTELLALQHTRDPEVMLWPLQASQIEAVLSGELPRAIDLSHQLGRRAEELGMAVRREEMTWELASRPLSYLGRSDAAPAARAGMERSLQDPGRRLFARATMTLQLGHAGQLADAALHAAQIREEIGVDPTWDDTAAAVLAALLEVAVLVEDDEILRIVVPRLEGIRAVTARYVVHPVARFCGCGARLIGDRPTARRALDHALAWATSIRHRPEIALTRLAMAELLLDEPTPRADSREARGRERAEGIDHLALAWRSCAPWRWSPVSSGRLHCKRRCARARLPKSAPPDLRGARPQRAHRRSSHHQYLSQAGCAHPRPGHRLCPHSWAGFRRVTRALRNFCRFSASAHSSPAPQRYVVLPMRSALGGSYTAATPRD